MRYFFPILFLFLFSCDEASFKGSASSEDIVQNNPNEPGEGGMGGGPSGNNPGGNNPGGNNPGGNNPGGKNPGGNNPDVNNPGGNNPGGNNPGGGSLDGSVDCIQTALNLNIVMVFDRSKSQTRTDMQNMQVGARGFVDNLLSFQEQKSGLDIKLSVVRFSTTSEKGPNAWIELSNGNNAVSQVQDDIDWATGTIQYHTNYHLGLDHAGELFNQIGALPNQPNQRNFIVFLSDGKPTNLNLARISSQAVVQNFGAAIISIGIGIKQETLLKEMANLKNPQTPPVHKGRYIPADRNTDAVANAFQHTEDIFKDLCL